jgi:hypothetical protein
MVDTHEKENMNKYLLHELTEEEREAMEEKLFLDTKFFEQLESAETQLVDRYVRGEMKADERKRFERGYLNSPERRAEVAEAGLYFNELPFLRDEFKVEEPEVEVKLQEAVPIGDNLKSALVDEDKNSWWARLKQSFQMPTFALQYGMAALIMVLALGLVWQFYNSGRLRSELETAQNSQTEYEKREAELRQELSQLEQIQKQRETELTTRRDEGLADQEKIADLQSEIDRLQRLKQNSINQETISALKEPPFIRLEIGSAGSPKGIPNADGEPVKIRINDASRKVNLQLPLALAPIDNQRFTVIIKKLGGAQIQTLSQIKPDRSRRGQSLFVSLPAKNLSVGEYIVTVRPESGEGKPLTFPFIIERNR